MGCDIHAVIEFQKYDSYWDFAEVRIDRDYKLFSALAFGDGGVTDDLPHPPRGLPIDHSLRVSDLFFVEAEVIREIEAQMEEEGEFDPEGIAKSWGDWALEQYRSYNLLPGPDWHTPSWLNFKELNEALTHANLKTEELSGEFRAALAAMQVLSEIYGPEKVRLVFWFDG
ncbi:MAG: hypothetical protein AB1631_05450 [Acidobacteriota bacterium]